MVKELSILKNDIDNFINFLAEIDIENFDDDINLLNRVNALHMRMNGVYGEYQKQFESLRKYLHNEYQAFWKEFDENNS